MFLKICFLILFPFFMFANQWCEHHFKQIEQDYKIPKNLLHAIALTESGKKISEKGMIAWPWSINVQGKGYIFPTKEKAVFAARFLQNAGIQSFDVGCMQINLMHHSDAFTSLEEAFDPEQNVRYAALFLKSLHQKHHNWHQASGEYHNLKPHFASPYKKKVLHYLEKLHHTADYSYKPQVEELSHIYAYLEDYFSSEQNIMDGISENANPINKIKSSMLEKKQQEHKKNLHHIKSHQHVHHYKPARVNTMAVRQTRYSFGYKPIITNKKTQPVHIASGQK